MFIAIIVLLILFHLSDGYFGNDFRISCYNLFKDYEKCEMLNILYNKNGQGKHPYPYPYPF